MDPAQESTDRSTEEIRDGLSRRRALQFGAAVAAAGVTSVATAGSADAATPAATYVGRTEASFDEGWRFLRADAAGAEATSFNDNSWRLLDVPHDWSIEDLPYAPNRDAGLTADPSTMDFQSTPPPTGTPTVIGPFDQVNSAGKAGTGYTVGGIGWYRKTFKVAAKTLATGGRVELRFDGVFHNYTVYLNGTPIGHHNYGYTPFTLNLTPNLVAGDNVLAVKVDNTVADARWYSGTGIYRHTWLTTTGPVRTPDFGVFITTPKATKAESTVHAAIDVSNYGAAVATGVSARVTLTAPNGKSAGSATTATARIAAGATHTIVAELAITNAALWSPASPNLYTAKTEILVAGKVVDTVETTFGIRRLVWDGQQGLLINGKATKIKGACLHAGYGPMGSQALNRSVERQVDTFLARGFNSIRTAHNPPTPHLLDYCDKKGVLVWDEAFDKWSGYTAAPDLVNDLTTFIKRDRNHPSVIIWSTGNEVNDAVTGLQLHNVVKSLDTTRPAVQGGRPTELATDPQYAYFDITDIHYDMSDTLGIRAAYPDRPMTQSEAWPSYIYDDWTFAQQNDWFVGSWVWAGWDYMGESGTGATITEPPGTTKLPVFGTGPFPWFQDFQSDIDLIGQPKPQNYWRNVVYGNSPVEMFVERPTPTAGTIQYAHYWSYYDELQSWTWNVPAGQAMTVHVYTWGDTATLKLNGKVIATQSIPDTNKRVATFTVPYAPGTLTATVSRDGIALGSKVLTTVGAPAAIQLVSDVATLTTDRDALAHVLAEVVDAKGRVVPDAVVKVSFDVKGAGSLVGIGNGNPHNMDSFQQPRRYTWHGQTLAIFRPAKNAGVLRITASADGLKSTTLQIPVSRA